MVKRVFTTVGTSIFTNYIKKMEETGKGEKEECKKVKKIYNKLKDDLYFDDKKIARDKKKIIEYLEEFYNSNILEASAELNSLKKLKDVYSSDISPILIYTDTNEDKIAAEINKYFLKNNLNLKVFDTKKIKSLVVKETSEKNINSGIDNFSRYLMEESTINDIYNITGGYKVLIPIATQIANLKNIIIHYIHEDSNNIINIHPLPLKKDFEICEIYEEIFQKIDNDNEASESLINKYRNKKKWDYMKNLIDNYEGIYSFSHIGDIFWKEYLNQQEADPIKTEIRPGNKKFKPGKDHHGITEVKKLWGKIKKSDYVEKGRTIDYNPSQKDNFIEHTYPDGKIDIRLTDTDEGFGLQVETTGRNEKETKKIADIIEKEYNN